MNGWIGVDFDGTLAYHKWISIDHTGEPIPEMVEKVKGWLKAGMKVKIVTARVSGSKAEAKRARKPVEAWCLEHLGVVLEVTCSKDFDMIELWDDRAVRVETNTGRQLSPSTIFTKMEDER